MALPVVLGIGLAIAAIGNIWQYNENCELREELENQQLIIDQLAEEREQIILKFTRMRKITESKIREMQAEIAELNGQIELQQAQMVELLYKANLIDDDEYVELLMNAA